MGDSVSFITAMQKIHRSTIAIASMTSRSNKCQACALKQILAFDGAVQTDQL
jgi:ATP-dependent helicase/DNAse subunit B